MKTINEFRKTNLPTFAECAAAPHEKRTALQNMIWEWTHPLALDEDEIPFFRKQLAAVIEEERSERDALAAENERLREALLRERDRLLVQVASLERCATVARQRAIWISYLQEQEPTI